MDDFKKKYCRECKAILGPYGFRCTKKGIFIRVVNDVVQSVTVDAPPSGPFKKWRRIGFGIVPLCKRPELEDVLSGLCGPREYLKEFEYGGPGSSDDGWEFEPTPEATDACVADIMRYITVYLIPFFEKANRSSSSALVPAFAEIREQFECTRQELLRAKGIEDHSDGKRAPLMDLFTTMFLALKEEDYGGAAVCAETTFGRDILWTGEDAKYLCRLYPAVLIPAYETLLARFAAHRREHVPLPPKHQALWDKMAEELTSAVHIPVREKVYSKQELQVQEGIRLSILDRADKLIEKESFVRRFWDKDWDYFRTLIRENEAYSREQFKDFIWTHPGD